MVRVAWRRNRAYRRWGDGLGGPATDPGSGQAASDPKGEASARDLIVGRRMRGDEPSGRRLVNGGRRRPDHAPFRVETLQTSADWALHARAALPRTRKLRLD
jgi:hypothetical protein